MSSLVWRTLVALLVVVVFGGPPLALFATADLAHLKELVTPTTFPKVLWVTLSTAAGGALLATAIGYLLARPFALYDWRGKRLERLLALLPYLVPNFILATGYVLAWNPETGLLQSAVPFPWGLYGLSGMTLLFAVVHAPVALLLFEAKLARLDPSLHEAARLAGAAPWKVVRRIELPLLRPAIAGAFAATFALNLSAFAIPAWIGAPAHAYPLTYKIYQAIQVEGQDGIPTAAVLAGVLFVLIAPVLMLLAATQRHEKRLATVTGKAARIGERRAGGAGFAVFQAGFIGYWALTFAAPVACIALSTVTPPGCLQSHGLSCLAAPSLETYRYVLVDLKETRLAFVGSGVYGTLSAAVVLAASVLMLMALGRTRLLLAWVEGLLTLLTATPGAIIALGLIVVASGRYGINLYNTPWIVVAAMLLKHGSLAFQPLRTGLANVSGSLVEAARLAGAPAREVWRRIMLPLLRADCAAGFFLALIPILGELTMSVFLASPSYHSFGTVIFELQDYADMKAAGALSMLLLAVILIANEGARAATGGKLGY